MERIKGAGHVNNRFVAEDAQAGRPPTELTADWFNDVQEEICSVIEAAGGEANGVSQHQLKDAISTLIAAVPSADVMVGATEAEAGTAGLVPAPIAGDEEKVLTGAGSWRVLQAIATSGSYNDLLDKPSCLNQTLATIDTGTIELTAQTAIYGLTVNDPTSISIDASTLSDHEVITFELRIYMPSVQTISMPTNVVWLDSATPDLSSPGTYLFAFRSYDQGVSWIGNLQGREV